MKYIKSHKEFILERYHPGKEIVIRPATTKEVLNFIENTYAATAPDTNLLDIVELNAEDGHEQHGAFENGKMVGVVKFTDSYIEDFTEIHLIYVDPDNRQKEIGKLLIQYVEDNADHKKLITNPYTDEAEKFFNKIGFIKDEEIDPNDTNTMIKENISLDISREWKGFYFWWDNNKSIFRIIAMEEAKRDYPDFKDLEIYDMTKEEANILGETLSKEDPDKWESFLKDVGYNYDS